MPDRRGRVWQEVIVIHVEAKNVYSILSPTTGFLTRCGFDYSLNTAIGCAFGCSYCYAAAFTQSQAPKGAEWGQWTRFKRNAGDLIAKAESLAEKWVYMSSVTDPYQPHERTHGVTRAVLQKLLEHHRGFGLVVQTRSPLVVRDIVLYQSLSKIATVQINLTISTDDDAIRKAFEPTCPSIEQRFSALEQLKDAGLEVAVTVTPMLPIGDVDAFAKRLAGIHPKLVVIQQFHADQGERTMVRGTRAPALEVLAAQNLSRHTLSAQAGALAKALRLKGVKAVIGERGFDAPK
jgi:DNA repair photolyase